MKTRLAGARLEALKMQLHPHFLFNTLNSILPLVFRDRDAASRTVVRLADLLRLSLQNEGSDLITLRKELELLQVYLEIQQTRFQDRLTVRLDVEPGLADVLVPNLILQPLVENAIKHGISARPGSGRVEVRAWKLDGGRLGLRVADDGPGPSEVGRRQGGEGVGLRNTRDRLELLYPGDHTLQFGGAPGRGFEVVLSFPTSYAPPVPAARPASSPRGAGPIPRGVRMRVARRILALWRRRPWCRPSRWPRPGDRLAPAPSSSRKRCSTRCCSSTRARRSPSPWATRSCGPPRSASRTWSVTSPCRAPRSSGSTRSPCP